MTMTTTTLYKRLFMGPVMICYCIFSARTYTKVTTSNLGEGQQKGREKAQTGKTRQRTDRP